MTSDEFDAIVDFLLDVHRPDHYQLEDDGLAPWMRSVLATLMNVADDHPEFARHLYAEEADK